MSESAKKALAILDRLDRAERPLPTTAELEQAIGEMSALMSHDPADEIVLRDCMHDLLQLRSTRTSADSHSSE